MLKDSFNPKEVLLEEIRSSYQMIFEIKSSLENKSRNLITVSALLNPLIIALINLSVPINYINIQNSYLIPLSIGLLLNIGSLWLSINSSKIKQYDFVMSDSDKDNYYSILRLPDDDFFKRIFTDYFDANELNKTLNENKSLYIRKSQNLLLVSIIFLTLSFLLKIITVFAAIKI
jgi:hypothetical protein